MAVSVRTRFEVFKRDEFTCRYCGKKSPEVVLEVDHITPVCEGGTDDTINLATSCWDCNRGKSGIALSEVITGEDPHDKAVLLLERRRQLEEYNAVLRIDREQRTADLESLVDYWTHSGSRYLKGKDEDWIFTALLTVPVEVLRNAMDQAIRYRKTSGLAYVNAIVTRWKAENMPEDVEGA